MLKNNSRTRLALQDSNSSHNYAYTNKLIAFSLIELIVTLSIVSLLLGISFSTLSKVKVESHRKEAQAELIKFKASIEQMAISGSLPDGTKVNSVIEVANNFNTKNTTITTPNGYYTIAVSYVTTSPTPGYTLTATAIGTQAKDSICPIITLQVSASSGTTGSVADDVQGPTATCWQ